MPVVAAEGVRNSLKDLRFYGATEGNVAWKSQPSETHARGRKTDLASRGAIGKGGFFFDKARPWLKLGLSSVLEGGCAFLCVRS